MKTKKIIIASILCIATLSNAQTKTVSTINPCDDLKKENEALKKSLNINQPISTVTDNEIEFNIIERKLIKDSRSMKSKLRYGIE